MTLAGLTGATREAQHLLRDPSHVHWSIVTLLAFVVYVYSHEIERRNYNAVLAGLAFWFADWFNEIVNALVLKASGHSALWTVTGGSSYVILIGLTIEISMMFAIAGIVFAKWLPEDKEARLLGMNARWSLAIGFSVFCVAVELLLHAAGIFHWAYWWWNWPCVPLIVVFGYLWFYWFSFTVYDMTDRRRQIRWVGTLGTIDATAILVFGVILGWI